MCTVLFDPLSIFVLYCLLDDAKQMQEKMEREKKALQEYVERDAR